MKKNIAGFILFASMAAVLAVLYSKTLAENTRVATLTTVRGEVMVVAAGQAAEKRAAEKMIVAEGDVVKTGSSGSSVIIRFFDGSMVKLGAMTALKVTKIPGSEGGKTLLDLPSGKTWSRVNKRRADNTFTTKTPTAIAGVRGTFYFSEVDNESTSKFDVFEGQVDVASTSDPEKVVQVKKNQTTTVAMGKDPLPPAPIPAAQLRDGRGGFTPDEFNTAKFDISINVTPQMLKPGEQALVSIMIFENGVPCRRQFTMKLKVSGQAVFIDTKTNEKEVTTKSDGSVEPIYIIDTIKESVTIDARMIVKGKKRKVAQ